jgi:hypothetical protein
VPAFPIKTILSCPIKKTEPFHRDVIVPFSFMKEISG